jgi:hypothetical protein
MKWVSSSPHPTLVYSIVTIATETGEGAILPTWTAVDANNVKTSKELYAHMKETGWNVDVRGTNF